MKGESMMGGIPPMEGEGRIPEKQSRFQQFFGRKKQRVSEEMPKIDFKGQKILRGSHPETSHGAIERQLYAVDKGPRMLPRKQRF